MRYLLKYEDPHERHGIAQVSYKETKDEACIDAVTRYVDERNNLLLYAGSWQVKQTTKIGGREECYRQYKSKKGGKKIARHINRWIAAESINKNTDVGIYIMYKVIVWHISYTAGTSTRERKSSAISIFFPTRLLHLYTSFSFPRVWFSVPKSLNLWLVFVSCVCVCVCDLLAHSTRARPRPRSELYKKKERNKEKKKKAIGGSYSTSKRQKSSCSRSWERDEDEEALSRTWKLDETTTLGLPVSLFLSLS